MKKSDFDKTSDMISVKLNPVESCRIINCFSPVDDAVTVMTNFGNKKIGFKSSERQKNTMTID
jgi:hypothetical protein